MKKRSGIRINRYRIRKAYICYKSSREDNKFGVIPSIRLALWWFSAGFVFEGDE